MVADDPVGSPLLPPGARVVELEIPARPDYLDVVRMVVATAASLEPSFADDRIADLRIAVSEACTNAIDAHADLGQPDDTDRIVIRCDLADDRIEVEVVDRGGGFDPGDLDALPAVEDPARLDFERGMGIELMRTLTDETAFSSSEEGTSVRLVVYHTRIAEET